MHPPLWAAGRHDSGLRQGSLWTRKLGRPGLPAGCGQVGTPQFDRWPFGGYIGELSVDQTVLVHSSPPDLLRDLWALSVQSLGKNDGVTARKEHVAGAVGHGLLPAPAPAPARGLWGGLGGSLARSGQGAAVCDRETGKELVSCPGPHGGFVQKLLSALQLVGGEEPAYP